MKKKKSIIVTLGILTIIVGAVLFFVLQDNENKLTTEERQWISENETKVQNISIINNSNLFGYLGEGIFYSYIKDFTNEYGLKLNPITINRNENSSGIVLRVGNELSSSPVDFYEDHFVMVSNLKEQISSISEIVNRKIGVLESDTNKVKNYLKNENLYTSFNNEDELFNALDQGTVSYLVIPRMEYINRILLKNYTINYHFSDLKRYYYIDDSSNSVLFRIMKKFAIRWIKDNLEKSLTEKERILFQTNLNISDSVLATLKKSNITFGYRVHAPYEVYGDHSFGGIFAKYLDAFQDFSGMEIKYKKYNNEKKMIKDLNNNKISLYANYDISMNTGVMIDTSIPLVIDIYAHESNPVIINSSETLKNYILYVEENTLAYQYLSNKEGLNLKTYKKDKLGDVLKDKNALLVLDEETGNYFQRTTLNKYTSRYREITDSTYVIRSLGNETLNTLLTKYFNYLDNHFYIETGFYDALVIENRGSIMTSLAKYALYGIIIVAFILFIIYRSSKKVRMQKKVKKEDRLKYIDQLTSLKNRNYLNENLTNWNKNTIYPQSIIMIDLDKVQEINDTLGYEEGDNQIKSAANSLIKTQLDNTDIMRTDGNEFVVYLIGYNQKQITSYLNKLKKDFKNLPYDYGATVAYSMIENDLKSIEDALNECIEDIKKQKEQKKEEEK